MHAESILIDALAYLNEGKNWIKDAYETKNGVCLSKALMHVSEVGKPGETIPEYFQARSFVREAIEEYTDNRLGLVQFNDFSFTKFEDVKAVLLKAIELSRK